MTDAFVATAQKGWEMAKQRANYLDHEAPAVPRNAFSSFSSALSGEHSHNFPRGTLTTTCHFSVRVPLREVR